ncbi:MAG: hypothetical protein LKE51_04020 [Selenomonas sp.]|jgi:hypothetical protein|nr:hypothetical protein [Selenomonas sp.]
MKNLEWCELTERFYAFKAVADKLGFYIPETNGMEQSLEECRPFADDQSVTEQVRSVREGSLPKIDFNELLGAKTPVFDENDELAHA